MNQETTHHSKHSRSLVGSLIVSSYALISISLDLYVLIASRGINYGIIIDSIFISCFFGLLLFKAFPRWFYIIFAVFIILRGISLFAGGLFAVIELREWIYIATIVQGVIGIFIGMIYCFSPGSGLGKLQIFQPYSAQNPAVTTQV